MAVHRVLQSWKEIADYVGRTERTLQRWEQEFGFPVHRPSGKSRSAVMALTKEIQEWTRGKPSLLQIKRSPRLERDELVTTPAHAHNSSATMSSSLPPSAHFIPEFLARECIRNFSFERLRVSGSLWKKQHTLRGDMRNLLAEQRRLCAALRLLRERRSANRLTKKAGAVA